MPRKPTVRQRKAVQRMLENNGNVSKSMREAGYPETTASNPHILTNSLGFQTLLNENISLQKLMQVGAEGLEAYQTHGKNGEIQSPDFATRHRYYETGLKLHGKLRPDAMDMQVNVIIPIVVKRGKDHSEDNRTASETV